MISRRGSYVLTRIRFQVKNQHGPGTAGPIRIVLSQVKPDQGYLGTLRVRRKASAKYLNPTV
jgi:hypothetical protein